jgi:hypothetical protein
VEAEGLECTKALLLQSVHMLEEGKMARLFTSEHMRIGFLFVGSP